MPNRGTSFVQPVERDAPKVERLDQRRESLTEGIECRVLQVLLVHVLG
jgi:hypothetical protein